MKNDFSKKFETLLRLVFINSSEHNARREPIGPAERLSVTLRYLVTGDAFCTIYLFYLFTLYLTLTYKLKIHNFIPLLSLIVIDGAMVVLEELLKKRIIFVEKSLRRRDI